MKQLIGVFLLTLFGTVVSDNAVAASFDCSKAGSNVEGIICNDETVSAADDELAEIYERVRSQDASAVAEQSVWLEQVRNICTDAECLSTAYLQRISTLEARLAQIDAASERTDSGSEASSAGATERYATSFDCSAKLNPAEDLICTDPTLASADVELANLIRQWSVTASYDRAAQRRWSSGVRDRCTTTDCLSSVYMDRIGQLEQALRVAAEAPVESSEAISEPSGNTLSPALIQARQQYMSIILWSTGLFFVVMFALGANRKLVICYGFGDLVWTVVPIIALGICGATFAVKESWSAMGMNLQILTVLSGALGIYAVARNFVTSVQHNRSLVAGLFVGIFKLLLGFLAFIIMFGSSGGSSDDRRSGGSSLMGTIVGLLLGYWLYNCIVNGPDVYDARGWNSDGASDHGHGGSGLRM